MKIYRRISGKDTMSGYLKKEVRVCLNSDCDSSIGGSIHICILTSNKVSNKNHVISIPLCEDCLIQMMDAVSVELVVPPKVNNGVKRIISGHSLQEIPHPYNP